MRKIMKPFSLVLLITLAANPLAGVACDNSESSLQYFEAREWVVKGPLSVDEVESVNIVAMRDGNVVATLPFGQMNGEWLSLKREMMPDDSIYLLSSPPEIWAKPLSGAMEGYGVFRNGCMVSFIRTRVS